MKQCLVMQHVAFEDLGTFAPVLEEKGLSMDANLVFLSVRFRPEKDRCSD